MPLDVVAVVTAVCVLSGIAMTPAGTIMAVNWRTKLITEMDTEGKVVKQFTSPDLQQPTAIAVNSQSHVVIADNTAECLFLFDNTGRWATSPIYLRSLLSSNRTVVNGKIVPISHSHDSMPSVHVN